jgi:hypothetical protein
MDDDAMNRSLRIAICVLTLTSTARAGEQRFDVKYNAHYLVPNGCHDDDVSHGLTGAKAYYGSGGFIMTYGSTLSTPIRFTLQLSKNHEPGVNIAQNEWNTTTNGAVCFYFAHAESGLWKYATPKNQPDSGASDGFQVTFELPLTPPLAAGTPTNFEFYATCRSCSTGSSTCQVRPGASQANLRIAGVVNWTADAGGHLTDCHIDSFEIDQSRNLGKFSATRYYPTMKGSPPACPSLDFHATKAAVHGGDVYYDCQPSENCHDRRRCRTCPCRRRSRRCR